MQGLAGAWATNARTEQPDLHQTAWICSNQFDVAPVFLNGGSYEREQPLDPLGEQSRLCRYGRVRDGRRLGTRMVVVRSRHDPPMIRSTKWGMQCRQDLFRGVE